MKYILLYEAFTTSDQDIAQRVEFRDKMIKDYKQWAGPLTTAYLNDAKDPEPAAQSILNKTAIRRGTNVTKNTYLVKLAQIQKDDRRVRELENDMKGYQEESSDLKAPADISQAAQIAQQLTQVKTDTKNTTDELNALKSKVAKDYKEFDKDMKDAIKDTKQEVADMKGQA